MSKPSLYIACGGTGLKTLRSLTELISQDPALRYSFNNDIFYVLIDTEAEELDKTHTYIEKRIPNLNHQHIVKIRTSSGATSLEPLVAEAFTTKDGIERLKEHWWFNENSQLPFVAAGVSPLDRGAGQCPPVSYFLTWRMMGDIEKKLEELFQTIIASRSGDRSKTGGRTAPLDGLNYHIISGVAGGTGRGCWELLAFKIRQVCTDRFGAAPKPKALLFDASVTASINFNKATQIGTKVNALTGYSQLNVWKEVADAALHTERLPEDFSYRLPSMKSPQSPNADVLVVEGQAGQKPPVDQAYLVFENSSVAVLSSSEDYYLMAGRALYAQLKFFEVGSQAINSTHFYNSLGASSFEVPATSLQQLYESGSRVQFLKSLASHDPELVQAGAEEFLDKFRFKTTFTARSDRGLFATGKESDFTIWQRIIQQIEQQRRAALESLCTNLEQDGNNLESLENQLDKYLSVPESSINSAVETVFQQLGDFVSNAGHIFQKMYYRGQEKNLAIARSVENVNQLCAVIHETVLSETDGCLASMPKSLSGIEIDDARKVFHEAKGRKFGVGKRFESREITDIKDACLQGIVIDNYEKIRDAYIAHAKAYLAPFTTIRINAAIVKERVDRILEEELSEMAKSAGVKNASECHRKVFADPKNPGGKDYKSDSRARFVRRLLKPAVEEEEFIEQCQSREVVKLRPDHHLDDFCFDRLFGAPLDSEKIEYGRQLRQELGSSVSISEDFIEKTFSLERVLATLQEAWRKYFARVAGSRDQYHEASEYYASIFGYKPSKNSHNEISLGTIPEMLRHMVGSLAASTAAYWELEEHGERKVHVFVPHFDGEDLKAKAGDFVAEVKNLLPELTTIEIYPGCEEGRSNPFAIVALHQEDAVGGPQKIVSMQYWNEPGVFEQLKLCEQPGARNAIFNPMEGMNGATFSDPIYINNTLFRDKRWRPWVSEEEKKAADIGESRVHQALLYLFLAPEGEYAQVSSEVQWSMPLAEFKSAGVVRFLRDGLEWDNKKCRTDNLSYIQAGKEIGRSRGGISGVKAWLASPDASDVLESILKERAHFWQMLEEHGNLTRKLTKHYEALCLGLESALVSLRQAGETNNQEDDDRIVRELIQSAKSRDQSLI